MNEKYKKMNPFFFRSLLLDHDRKREHFATSDPGLHTVLNTPVVLSETVPTDLSEAEPAQPSQLPQSEARADPSCSAAPRGGKPSVASEGRPVEPTSNQGSDNKESNHLSSFRASSSPSGSSRTEQSKDNFYQELFNERPVDVDPLPLLQAITGTINMAQVVERIALVIKNSGKGQKWLADYVTEAGSEMQDGQRLGWLCEMIDVVCLF